MFEWLKENFTIIKGIFVPLIIAIIGLFSYKTLIKKKSRIKSFCTNNLLLDDEIKNAICAKIPRFENILNIWDKNVFSNFSLTTVGIAIGRAYLEQKNFGNFDINIWIN